MPIPYTILLIHEDRDAWAAAITSALDAELRAIGLHELVELRVADDLPAAGERGVGLYLGSTVGAESARCAALIESARAAGIVVVPVVTRVANYKSEAPTGRHGTNGCGWADIGEPSRFIARVLCSQLGLEDPRRVFISYPWADARPVADQLHERLTRRGFTPFVDRYAIDVGDDIQDRILESLDDFAFVLVLEAPMAHVSPWIYREVQFAAFHGVELHIVSWPGDVTPIPLSDRLPRDRLRNDQLLADGSLTDAALDEICDAVEAAHAPALAVRRGRVMTSVTEAALAAGLTVDELSHDRLLVTGRGKRDIVLVTPRLPGVDDLYDLDQARAQLSTGGRATEGVLVHAARRLSTRSASVLEWAQDGRHLVMLPDHAIGGYW